MFDWRWGREFFRFLRTNRVDVVHAHEFTANTYGALVARLAGVPVIATVHGKSYYLDQLKRRLAYRAASRMATMVAVSEDLKRFLVSNLNMPPARVRVVYNGVPDFDSLHSSEVERLRKEIDVPCNHKIVGVFGSFYTVKGHTYLLQAIPDIVKRVGRVTFLFAGRGELEPEIKRQASELGIQEHVRFLGFRNDIPRLLSLLDLFVLPSLSEGLSIAILEAMAAGIPVVATEVGGNPELILNGETGYLVPPMNPSALSIQVAAVLEDDRLRVRLGQASQRRVKDRFSLATMVKQYEQLYRECLANG
jgi:glycosyltransferase involved in cell wall biosynthesis